MIGAGLIIVLFFALAAGKPVPRSLQVREAREAPPAGFTLTGPASPNTVLNLRLALVSSNTDGLTESLNDVSTPSSPNYGQFLSNSKVQAFITPTSDSVSAVNGWLAENDITATTITPTGNWLSISIPVGQANELFDADFSIFTHKSSGQQSIRTLSYFIPMDLQNHLDLVHLTITCVLRASLLPHSAFSRFTAPSTQLPLRAGRPDIP